MCRVTGPKESFSTYKKVRIMLPPKHTATIAKMIFNTIDGPSHGFDHEKTTSDIERTVNVGKRRRLFRAKAVSSSLGVVFHVTAGCLIYQPFPDIAFVCRRFLRQFG